mmetsp:Transcript_2034/g.13132  ORF Transcript_2034/g.13132 Transcript_2034/m.13132 type:complete len:277 (+) Transcript_2034:569-1399(+)
MQGRMGGLGHPFRVCDLPSREVTQSPEEAQPHPRTHHVQLGGPQSTGGIVPWREHNGGRHGRRLDCGRWDGRRCLLRRSLRWGFGWDRRQIGDGQDPTVHVGSCGSGVHARVDPAVHAKADDPVLQGGPRFQEGSPRIPLTGVFVGRVGAHHFFPQGPVDGLAGGLGSDLEFHFQEPIGERSSKGGGSPAHDQDVIVGLEGLSGRGQYCGVSVLDGPLEFEDHGVVSQAGGMVGWMFDDLLDLDLHCVLQVLVSLVGAGTVSWTHGGAHVSYGFVV